MSDVSIQEVSIDADGRLCVTPSAATFPYIHRAAMEVGWDASKAVLFGGIPREWSYQRWFQQIVAAASSEYGVRLRLHAGTAWTNVSSEVRSSIVSVFTD